VLHSKTKYIEVRYHFLTDNVEKGNIDLIHVPTEKQLDDILTKSLDQATFARLWVSLVWFFHFELRLGILCTYACCISCIISCLHLCIIDYICIICFRDVLLLYTLITMMCCMWAYDFASEALVIYSCALGSFGIYMHVDGLFCANAIYDPLLWVECLSCSNCAHMAISCLICAWVSCSFHLGSNTYLSSWMFSLHVTLWRSLSFFMYHAQFVNHEIGMWDAYSWKICFYVKYALNSLSWVLNRCMMFTIEKSHI
jgi:hypothetical protein